QASLPGNRARQRREPAHVGTQRLGDRHRAIFVLVVLEHRDQGAADGEARAVQGVHEARSFTFLGPIARAHAAGLVVAAVRAARDLAIGVLSRQPDFYVESLARGRTNVAAAQHDGAEWQAEPLQDLLGAAGHALVLGDGLLGRGDAD